mmetsp:Transcript_9911/g.18688  ORF Transcript_9911/g.18688 Transcript_9911/m.18688 type:complete len:476 (+) Transcript_9911:107-1534(+)
MIKLLLSAAIANVAFGCLETCDEAQALMSKWSNDVSDQAAAQDRYGFCQSTAQYTGCDKSPFFLCKHENGTGDLACANTTNKEDCLAKSQMSCGDLRASYCWKPFKMGTVGISIYRVTDHFKETIDYALGPFLLDYLKLSHMGIFFIPDDVQGSGDKCGYGASQSVSHLKLQCTAGDMNNSTQLQNAIDKFTDKSFEMTYSGIESEMKHVVNFGFPGAYVKQAGFPDNSLWESTAAYQMVSPTKIPLEVFLKAAIEQGWEMNSQGGYHFPSRTCQQFTMGVAQRLGATQLYNAARYYNFDWRDKAALKVLCVVMGEAGMFCNSGDMDSTCKTAKTFSYPKQHFEQIDTCPRAKGVTCNTDPSVGLCSSSDNCVCDSCHGDHQKTYGDCSMNSHCETGFCLGGGIFSSTIDCGGTCVPKLPGGAACPDDGAACISGECDCGRCHPVPPGGKCSTDANCASGTCSGWITLGCSGHCE